MFNCNICNYVSKYKQNFERHNNSKSHLQNMKNLIRCKYCDKVFSSKSYLKIHMQSKCKEKININSETKSETNSENDINYKNKENSIEILLLREIQIRERELQLKERENDLLIQKRELQLQLKEQEIQLKEKEKQRELELKDKDNDKEKEILKLQLSFKDKIIEDKDKIIQDKDNNLQEERNYNKKFVNKTIELLTNRYPNSKPLYIIEDLHMQLMNNNKQLVDKTKDEIENIGYIIVRKHQKNLLIKELSDIFVQEYIKNQTPETQGVWVSDLSRLSYIIKEQNEENNTSEWKIDKNGIILNQNYIKLVLHNLRNIIIQYNNILWEKITENYSHTLEEEAIASSEIITDINNNILGSKIIKHFAQHCVLQK